MGTQVFSMLACQAKQGGNTTKKSSFRKIIFVHEETRFDWIYHGYSWSWGCTSKPRLAARWTLRNERFASASGTTHEKVEFNQQAYCESDKLLQVLERLIFLCYQPNLFSRLPMLSPGPIAQPYVTSTDGIARADRNRLVNEKDRHIITRRVEDSIKVEEKIKKVGRQSCIPSPFPPMTKNGISNYSWRRIIGPVLGTPSAFLRVSS